MQEHTAHGTEAAVLARWQWKRDVPKFSFQAIQKRNRMKILSYHRYGEHALKKLLFQDYLFTALYAAELARSR